MQGLIYHPRSLILTLTEMNSHRRNKLGRSIRIHSRNVSCCNVEASLEESEAGDRKLGVTIVLD